MQEGLEGSTILSELPDALVELVERHLIIEQRPAELGFVINEGDLLQGLTLGRCE